jgi:hypothetical protein
VMVEGAAASDVEQVAAAITQALERSLGPG